MCSSRSGRPIAVQFVGSSNRSNATRTEVPPHFSRWRQSTIVHGACEADAGGRVRTRIGEHDEHGGRCTTEGSPTAFGMLVAYVRASARARASVLVPVPLRARTACLLLCRWSIMAVTFQKFGRPNMRIVSSPNTPRVRCSVTKLGRAKNMRPKSPFLARGTQILSSHSSAVARHPWRRS